MAGGGLVRGPATSFTTVCCPDPLCFLFWCSLCPGELLSVFAYLLLFADLLVPGTNVFYLRGTIGQRVLATVVGISSFPKCVAISYERSDHAQLYCDCPVERLTSPIGDLVTYIATGQPLRIVFVFGIFNNEGRGCLKTKLWEPNIAVGTKHFQVALIISQNLVGHRVPV